MSCIERCPHFTGKFRAYLGHSNVSLIQRCPYFRGVLYEGFHCIPFCLYLGFTPLCMCTSTSVGEVSTSLVAIGRFLDTVEGWGSREGRPGRGMPEFFALRG